SSLAPFPAFAGKRRSLQHPRWRPLSRDRQARGREDDLGLDRHPLRLRPAGRLLSARSMLRTGTPAWLAHWGKARNASAPFPRFSTFALFSADNVRRLTARSEDDLSLGNWIVLEVLINLS